MNRLAFKTLRAAYLATGVLLMFTALTASAALPALRNADGKPTLAPLLERVTPAVVNIAVESKVSVAQNPLMMDPFFRRFFDVPDRAPIQPSQSAGSGVIVDAKKGYVLTNHHVIDNAGEITVTLKDRRSFKAKLIGFAVPVNMVHSVMEQLVRYGEVRRGRLGIGIQDLTPDLAQAMKLMSASGAVVNQIEADSPADNAGLRPGDVVVEIDGRAVNNASDLRNRVGLMRVGEHVEVTVLRDGERKSVRARIGKVGATKVAGGESSAALRGAVFGNLEQGHPLYGKAEGTVVSALEPGSPAARNGLRPGDVIVAVNRQAVRGAEEFRRAVNNAGRVLALNVVRGGTGFFLVIQ